MKEILENAVLLRNSTNLTSCVVYYLNNVQLEDIEPILEDIILHDTDFWKVIKSMTWSANCRHFILIERGNIIAGNTIDNHALLCKTLSTIFLNQYMNVIFKTKN